MTRRGIRWCSCLLLGGGGWLWAVAPARIVADPPAPAGARSKAFFADLAAKNARAEKDFEVTVRGKEGWLFFASELRSLGVGRFWGAAAAKASRSPSPATADPLPAILDFKAQLDRAGIELLLVPVPAKAVIYPEMISDTVGTPAERLDVHHQEFYALLASKGVKALDLAPLLFQQKGDKESPLYCRQDTHWSGRACVLAARRIAEEIKDREWLRGAPKRIFESEPREVEITGDLWEGLEDAALPKEKLTLTFVRERKPGGSLAEVAPWRQSPVVLLGDSHNLVFHAGGDMLARGAGLPDQLARELGFPVDLVAVRGSGATPARVNLRRRGDNLAGKRLVVWCFSVREFTEADGWKKVPVIGGAKAKRQPPPKR